jgi:hypothetical protein
VKRTTLIAAALCFALGAFSSFAEAGLRGGRNDAMQRDSMGKPDTHDKMGNTDTKGKRDKMGKTDTMDRMEKPGAMQ